MVTLELIEHLVTAGFRVVLATHAFESPMRDEIVALGDVDVLQMSDPTLDERLRSYEFVLIWIHHHVVPGLVASGEVDAPIVFNHMSGSHPIEYPILPQVERKLATLSLYNSEETLEAHRSRGALTDFDQSRIMVHPNPAPDEFFDVLPRVRPPASKPRIAVISNHVPREVLQAMEILGEFVQFDMFGDQNISGAMAVRVRAQTFDEVDAVITIGKTVQYAISASRPVYCYDVFGGPGWLDGGNLDQARFHNFSGRGFDKKTSEEIAAELLDGLDEATTAVTGLRSTLGESLRLSTRVTAVLQHCRDNPHAAERLTRGERFTLQLFQDFTANWIRSTEESARRERKRRELASKYSAIMTREQALRSRSSELEVEQAALTVRISELEASSTSMLESLHTARAEVERLRGRAHADHAELETLRQERNELRVFRNRRAMRLMDLLLRPIDRSREIVRSAGQRSNGCS